ncbi:MAG: peptide chain release factor N(5)-glutamine methyltransferase [Candidatus Saccharibacteria bacterium]|nr:MAG: peptide chain release factor N(5)-glutamine methyltransferase [Candidatus Saccharibacteria bacterium]
MSANLQPKAPAIKEWLSDATRQLAAVGITSAKLDSEIILAHTLRKSRTYLHAHDDEPIDSRQLEIADTRLLLRLDRTPIAYIIGHKEFYGRLFRVTPSTLIPRPESEDIITLIKESLPQASLLQETKKLVDVGTGSGCLGISAKLEMPELEVTLLDISKHALNVAEQNAKQLRANVTVVHSDLLANFPFTADYIIANLPYVDPEWERSPETSFEPELALFTNNNGLHLIFKLLQQATSRLTQTGLLLLEADPRQHAAIIKQAKTHGFLLKETRGFIVCFQQA